MKRDRVLAAALTVLAAVTVGVMSYDVVFPVAVSLIALLGIPGKVQLRLSRYRRTVTSLLIALGYAVYWRFGLAEQWSDDGLFFFSAGQIAAEFLVTVQLSHLFVRHERGIPLLNAVYGALAVVAAGVVVIYAPWQLRVYPSLCLAYIVGSGVFFSARQAAVRTNARPRRVGRWLAQAVTVAMATVGMALLAGTLREQEGSLSDLMRYHPLNPSPERGVGFSARSELTSIRDARTSRQTNRVTLRIVSDRAPGYLRGQVHERYARNHWSGQGSQRFVSPTKDPAPYRPYVGNDPVFLLRSGKIQPTDGMEIWADPGVGATIFTPIDAVAVSMPVEFVQVSDHHILRAEELPGGVNYFVVRGRAARPDRPLVSTLRDCRQVPPEYVDLLKQVNAKVIPPGATTKEKARAIETYFRTNYKYRFGIRVPRGRDPLEYFLEDRPPAHCEYFATAATLLLRAAGVPTRYVVGFVATERAPEGGYWIVRNRDAHAWCEAYDESTGQWFVVEATPGEGVPGGRQADWVDQFWDVVIFQMQRLRVLTHRDGLKGLFVWLWDGVVYFFRGAVTTWHGRGIGLLLLVYTIWRIRGRLKGWRRWRGRKRRRRKPDPRVVALHRELRAMDRRVRRAGFARDDSETIHHFAGRLADAAVAGGEALADRSPSAADPFLAAAARWYRRYAELRYRGAGADEAVTELRSARAAVG